MYFTYTIEYLTSIEKRMKWFHLQQHGWQQQTCKRTESYKRMNVVCFHLHGEDKVDLREVEIDLMRPDPGKSFGERMQRDTVRTSPPDASVKSLTDLPCCSHLQQRADRPHSFHKR